jgi:hypothetical protein
MHEGCRPLDQFRIPASLSDMLSPHRPALHVAEKELLTGNAALAGNYQHTCGGRVQLTLRSGCSRKDIRPISVTALLPVL